MKPAFEAGQGDSFSYPCSSGDRLRDVFQNSRSVCSGDRSMIRGSVAVVMVFLARSLFGGRF